MASVRPSVMGAGSTRRDFVARLELSPKLGEAFDRLLVRRRVSLADLYKKSHEHEDLFQTAERLLDWDQRLVLWRDLHLKLVERIIGGQVIGTQGTPVEVLGRRIDIRYFEPLWNVRNALTDEAQTSPEAG